MDIQNKYVIVTGGAKGIGRAITEKLLQSGAKVAVYDIDHTALEKMENRDGLLKIQCDLTKENDIQKALMQTIEKFGGVDVLINNAGVLYSDPLINIMATEKRHSLQNWQKVIDINLTTPFMLASYVVEQMIMNRTQGIIINISSISARGNAGQSAYSAAKAGLEAMTKVWSKELGGFGIRSVAIAPGFMDTESTKMAISEATMEEIREKTPIKRLGKAEHVSATVKFVIENDYVNGKVLEIDGGLVL